MYDFDTIAKRKNTNCLKWDECKNGELPMWVADMDFYVADPIRKAVEEKAKVGAYGYSVLPDAYFEAFRDFWARHHDVVLDTKWMVFSTGVVPTISSSVRKLTGPGDAVLIMAPVYNIFYNSIINNGRTVISSDLVYEKNEYHIDFKDLEEKLSRKEVTLFILCNPHNPVGKIWSEEELHRIGLLCLKYNVTVLSDEIHCDIVRPGKSYVPFLKAAPECKDITVMAIAASKCFNIAGLSASCVVVPNPDLRFKVWRQINTDECGENNFFGAEATIAALTECDEWLSEMNDYVFENRRVFKEMLEKEIPEVKIIEGDATYLLWVNVEEISKDASILQKFLKEEGYVYVSSGEAYGTCAKGFLRINLATSRENVITGCKRLIEGINNWRKKEHAVK